MNNPKKPWIVSGLTKEQAELKYQGKAFRIEYEPDHVVHVHVNSVAVYGGVVLAFCDTTKVLRRYKNKTVAYPKDVTMYAGRLEDIKIGGTSCD